MHVSCLLLSSENMCGTRPLKWVYSMRLELTLVSSINDPSFILETINSKNTNLFVDLPILKYIIILSLDLQQSSLYIYIYIYIYCYPHTDCFIVSQIFRVAKHTRCFKLGSKPGWIYPGCIIILKISEIFFLAYISIYTLPECWIYEKKLGFTRLQRPASLYSSTQPPRRSIYIIIHRQTYLKKGMKLMLSSSSSCRAANTDIPDPLLPLFPIVHRLRQIFRASSRILT